MSSADGHNVRFGDQQSQSHDERGARSVKLTAGMRDALQRARAGPLRRTHTTGPGRSPWPAPWQTIHALEARGLLAHTERPNRNGDRLEEWAITDAGRQALDQPPRARRAGVSRIRVPGGSTRIMQLGTWIDVGMPEPEPMTPAPGWVAAARVRHADVEDRGDHARRIAARRRVA
jgi:hypothetical protein